MPEVFLLLCLKLRIQRRRGVALANRSQVFVALRRAFEHISPRIIEPGASEASRSKGGTLNLRRRSGVGRA